MKSNELSFKRQILSSIDPSTWRLIVFQVIPSFTSAQPRGKDFCSTNLEAKWNQTCSGSQPYMVHYRTVRKQDLYDHMILFNDISLNTSVSHKHQFTSCEVSFMSIYRKVMTHLFIQTCTKSFPALRGVVEKRESCQNSLKATKKKRWDFKDVKGSFSLCHVGQFINTGNMSGGRGTGGW